MLGSAALRDAPAATMSGGVDDESPSYRPPTGPTPCAARFVKYVRVTSFISNGNAVGGQLVERRRQLVDRIVGPRQRTVSAAIKRRYLKVRVDFLRRFRRQQPRHARARVPRRPHRGLITYAASTSSRCCFDQPLRPIETDRLLHPQSAPEPDRASACTPRDAGLRNTHTIAASPFFMSCVPRP
jgi:hypothetical protein